jgi:hypothetical protein
MTNPFRIRCHVCDRSKFCCECGWVIAGIAATVISAAVSAYGAYSQGQQQEQAAKTQQTAYNIQAQNARNAAQTQEDIARERDRHFLAEQRAAVGGGGLSTEGSPLEVMVASSQQAELDALRARYTGELEGSGLGYQGKIARYRGGQAATASYYKAGTSLLTGALSAAGGFSKISGRPGSLGYGTIDPTQAGPGLPY